MNRKGMTIADGMRDRWHSIVNEKRQNSSSTFQPRRASLLKSKDLFRLLIAVCFILVLAEWPSVPAWGAPSGELRIGLNTLYTETFHPYRGAARSQSLPGHDVRLSRGFR